MVTAEIRDYADPKTPRPLARYTAGATAVEVTVLDPKAKAFAQDTLTEKNPTGHGFVTAAQDPEAWVRGLPMAFTGSRIRAHLVEDEIPLDPDPNSASPS